MGVAVVGVGCDGARAPSNRTRRLIIDAFNVFDYIVTRDVACDA